MLDVSRVSKKVCGNVIFFLQSSDMVIMKLSDYEIMKDNNNFIPRHGSPLFYPQDPSEGFQGASGGLSRRKFLKRTGGVTAAATFAGWYLGLQPVNAHEDNFSEYWVMDWVSVSPEGGSDQQLVLLTLPDGNGGSTDFTLHMNVDADIEILEPFEDVSDLSFSVFFAAILVEVGGGVVSSVERGCNVTVSCNLQSGHISSDVSLNPSAGETVLPLLEEVDVLYGGITYTLKIENMLHFGQGDHNHTFLAEASSGLYSGSTCIKKCPAGAGGAASVANLFSSHTQ